MYHFMNTGTSYSDTAVPACSDGSLAAYAVIQDAKLPLLLDKSADTDPAAKAALYRTCARCMPAEYKIRKASQEDMSGRDRK